MTKRILLAASLVLFAACAFWGRSTEADRGTAACDSDPSTIASHDICLNMPKQLTPDLPADSILTEQPEVNCFGWQEFIALSWRAGAPGRPDPAATSKDFGAPGFEPVVWETFKTVSEVFPPRGATPTPWGDPQDLPAGCGDSHGLVLTRSLGYHALSMTEKFSADLADRQVLDDIQEAGIHPPSFLTAQNRTNVYYEVRFNQDFFNYIVDPQNQFYDARNQYAAVQPGGQGIDLPASATRYGPVGAIEIKAAWLEILDKSQWDQFLMTDAVLVEPGPVPRCRPAKMGLVGLHIIHKTSTMPNWTWATFEHVRNAPDRVEVAKGTLHPPYLFYNPDCKPRDSPQCQPNRKPQPGDPRDVPIQVVREVPIPGYVAALNQEIHDLIRKANPKSVFLNYRMVNTMWPPSGVGFPVGGITPLSEGGAAPTTGLSNLTAETYVQTTACLDCHQHAPIACSSASGPNPTFAADYSFQMSRASEPNPAAFCRSGG